LATYRLGESGSGPRHVEQIAFGGRTWRLGIEGAGEPVYQAWTATTPWLGVLGSALLAALVWSLMRTRERAMQLGTAMSERFRASEERFRKLTELLPSLVMVARRDDGRVVYQNATARARLGAGTVGCRLDTLFEPAPFEALLAQGNGTRMGDIEVHPRGGAAFWASAATSPIEIDGEPMWLLVANDVSEQRRLTERLSYQASHDSLTKLLNRREFEARISEALAAPGGPAGALLFVDLDQFKIINDTSGHRAGDELLVQLAAVMREKLRPGDVLGRLGGDEFGVLLGGLHTRDAAAAAAERLRRTVEAFSFSWEQRIYTTSASIGAVMLGSADSLKELFSCADAACYLAKEEGRNRVHFYSEDDAAVTTRLGEMEWASRLRNAIRDGHLRLDYQELHPFREGACEPPHVELLLRLCAEDGREVMPGAFLPAAERYGLMPAVDRWVVETALRNLDRLHPSGAGLATCAINLSGASLEDGGLVQFIEELVRECGVDPGRLLFEITETVAMRDFAASSALIARLRALGCRVALDDFGAGMSSFGYMKNLELDMVKIDGSFVQELASDRMSQSIVRAVTEIGHQQGLKVVAEWVSCPQMVGLLRAMGVDYGQGFALHRPERVLFQRRGAA
jgi:diguanylate cyclase (GGDEF)-like protein